MNVSIDIIEPYISEVFGKTNLTQKPIVAVHSREQRKTLNFIKTFYLKYPQYRWITFRDMRGLTETEFANTLKECFLSVWIDETSGYGTFPLESMKSGVPCLAKVPNLHPNWINENNGVWVDNEIKLCDFTADFIQNWLEDNISPKLYDDMDKTVSELPTKDTFEKTVVSTVEDYFETRIVTFEEQLTRLKPQEIE